LIACEAAISHLLEQGECFSGDETLTITCTPLDHGMEILLHGMGTPFDPERQQGFVPGQNNLEGFSLEGLGLFLMGQLLDSLSFTPLGNQGIQVRLAKHWPEGQEQAPRPDAAAEATPQSGPSPAPTIDVRVAAPEEAVEIARCATAPTATAFSTPDYDYRHLACDIAAGTVTR
jgi:hypothetical protein